MKSYLSFQGWIVLATAFTTSQLWSGSSNNASTVGMAHAFVRQPLFVASKNVQVLLTRTSGCSRCGSNRVPRRKHSRHYYSTPPNKNGSQDNRSDELRQVLLDIGQVFDNKEEAKQIRVGSTVVANSNLPDLQIWQFQSYTVKDIWDQGERRQQQQDVEDTTTTAESQSGGGIVEKITCASLDDPVRPGYTRYISLYSAKHHENPVTVDPSEVTLVSLKDEVVDSVLMALPLFGFWTALAISFAVKYNERYGGNFMDAFFGR